MSKISIYEVVPVPKLADKLVGTSVGGDPEDITYNFTLSELLNLFIPNIPGNTLQGVLDFGNTATQNINLTGIITTTTLNVGSTANILNSNLTGQTKITGGLYDRLNSIGTAGQVLTSTGTQVAWYTIPTVIPDLQQVLTSGNTAVNNIILTGNLSANNAALLTSTISTSLTVLGTLRDGLSSVGANNQVLSSNVTGVRWVNLPVYSATSPLLYNSGTGVFSIQQANASQNGYLSSADWITFDGKQTAISLTTTGNSGPSTLVGATINVPNYTLSGLGGVPLTRTLTINGVTYNLSADRTWTIAAGVSSVTATTPLFSTGGVNPDISIQQSSSTLNGYLSNTDWLTFNSKQPAGNYITSLTGEATAVGPGATAVTLSTAAVTGKLLTGLNLAAGGTISATDSILIAFGKTQNQISALLGGVIFKGVWNANTNTPTLVSSVGVQGNYYIVNVAGNTNLNGITDWQVGDWAIFNGTVWDKVDNTDAVSSVNGFTGAVSLTTDNIPEGATNLYYTNTRARTALSFVAGSGAYNNTTGVITIPTNNNQITNGANYITLASLSAVSPLNYINTTGVFSISQATTSTNGYLSSTDWNTFNNKQNAITLTTTGSSGAATLIGATLNIPQYQSVLTNPITGTGTSGQVAYFNGTNSITSNAAFAFTPTSQLLVNNSVTAASAIARGTNLTPTLTAAANNDVLVGLDINPTFSNGAFTGVSNIGLRVTGAATISSSLTADSLLVNRTASRNMLGISSIALPTSGAEEGVAVIKTNSTLWQLSTVGYLAQSKGVRFYNNGGTGYTALEVVQFGGTRFIIDGGGLSAFSNSLAIGFGATTTAPTNGLAVNSTITIGATSASGSQKLNVISSTDGIIAGFTNGVNDLVLDLTSGVSLLRTNVGAISLGATSTEGLRMFATTRNVLIQNGGTFTDAGFRLDVNGTARVQGQATIQGMTVGLGGGANANSVAVGLSSLASNSTGSANTSIGASSLNLLSSGAANTSVGFSALSASNGTGNTSLGASTFRHLTSGDLNVAIGQDAGRYIADGVTQLTTSNNSVFLGMSSRPLATAQTNQIVIGYQAIGLGSNTTVLGNASTTLTALYGSVITGGTSVNASAQLQIESTTKGFLPPRMTSAQRTAIASPATGLIVYQTDSVEGLYVYSGGSWKSLTMV